MARVGNDPQVRGVAQGVGDVKVHFWEEVPGFLKFRVWWLCASEYDEESNH